MENDDFSISFPSGVNALLIFSLALKEIANALMSFWPNLYWALALAAAAVPSVLIGYIVWKLSRKFFYALKDCPGKVVLAIFFGLLLLEGVLYVLIFHRADIFRIYASARMVVGFLALTLIVVYGIPTLISRLKRRK